MKTKITSQRGSARALGYNYSKRPSLGLKFVSTVAIAFAAMLTTGLAGKGNKNPGVIPHTPGTAKMYSDLSAAWRDWQHGVIEQTGFDPFRDDPPEDLCAVNQGGKVWFLAGAASDPDNPVVRNCTVPAGTFIHFPIINAAWITTSQKDADDIGDPVFFDFVNGILDGAMTAPDVTLSVVVDGQALGNLHDYYVQSPIFELPYYGSLEDGFLNFDYGYYILLAPLSAGDHTIHIAGSFPFFGNTFGVDVTYNITVVGG